jgi:hypothetical protein
MVTTSVVYPESDGLPMADNTRQFWWIVYIKVSLDWLFRAQPQVFVAGDLLWYPVEGNNKICQAPDVMVVFGRPKGDRGSYLQWRENNLPPQVNNALIGSSIISASRGSIPTSYDGCLDSGRLPRILAFGGWFCTRICGARGGTPFALPLSRSPPPRVAGVPPPRHPPDFTALRGTRLCGWDRFILPGPARRVSTATKGMAFRWVADVFESEAVQTLYIILIGSSLL